MQSFAAWAGGDQFLGGLRRIGQLGKIITAISIQRGLSVFIQRGVSFLFMICNFNRDLFDISQPGRPADGPPWIFDHLGVQISCANVFDYILRGNSTTSYTFCIHFCDLQKAFNLKLLLFLLQNHPQRKK
jgi:hypothetical protein